MGIKGFKIFILCFFAYFLIALASLCGFFIYELNKSFNLYAEIETYNEAINGKAD